MRPMARTAGKSMESGKELTSEELGRVTGAVRVWKEWTAEEDKAATGIWQAAVETGTSGKAEATVEDAIGTRAIWEGMKEEENKTSGNVSHKFPIRVCQMIPPKSAFKSWRDYLAAGVLRDKHLHGKESSVHRSSCIAVIS